MIDAIIKKMTISYIYPEMARKMTGVLLAQSKKGNYDQINDPVVFAARLRDDMLRVTGDRHLNITFDPQWVQAIKKVLGRQGYVHQPGGKLVCSLPGRDTQL